MFALNEDDRLFIFLYLLVKVDGFNDKLSYKFLLAFALALTIERGTFFACM
jgi:hypothetical protein